MMTKDSSMPAATDIAQNPGTEAAPRTEFSQPSVGAAKAWPRRSKIANVFLLARVFVVAAAVPHLLKRRLDRVAETIEPGTIPSPVDPHHVSRIAAYVETAIRHGKPFVRTGCLTRGVTRYYFLRRAGLDVALYFGMGQIDGSFIGHCWLVRDGQPFLEREDVSRYVVMYRVSAKGGEPANPGAGNMPVGIEP